MDGWLPAFDNTIEQRSVVSFASRRALDDCLYWERERERERERVEVGVATNERTDR